MRGPLHASLGGLLSQGPSCARGDNAGLRHDVDHLLAGFGRINLDARRGGNSAFHAAAELPPSAGITFAVLQQAPHTVTRFGAPRHGPLLMRPV